MSEILSNWWYFFSDRFTKVETLLRWYRRSERHIENSKLRRQKTALQNTLDSVREELKRSQRYNQHLLSEREDLIKELDRTSSQEARLQKQIALQDDNVRKLQDEVFGFKRSISSSTRIEGQLSDECIQESMEGLYHAVRDWAFNVVRKDKTSKSGL